MYYGALEAGGTKMVCAIGDADKNIIDRISIPTGTPDQSLPAMIDYFMTYPLSESVHLARPTSILIPLPTAPS